MTVKIAHLCPVTAAACLLLLLSSCVFDRESCPPVEGSGAYSLSIRIGAQALATRAANHGEEPASEAEDFINVKGEDYCVYLLDGDGRVKQRFVPTAMTLVQGSDKVYQLTGDFIPEMDRMQVMVLANWKAFGGEYGYDLIGRSLEDLYAGDGDLIFTYPADDGKSWMPSVDAEGIPMFGLSEVFEVKKELSIPNNRYEVTVEKDVKMLRSLSKVEVTNETARNPDGTDEDGHAIEIVSCRLTGYNTTGRFIPDLREGNAEWDQVQSDGKTGTETKQVVSPSMPAGGNALSAAGLLFGGNEGDASFTAYVPEMVLPTDDSRPRIEVILSIDEEEHEPYYIELAEYKDGVVGSGYEALLRNHHYQFNITKVEVGVSTDLIIHIETKAWEIKDDEFTYDDLKFAFADASAAFQWDKDPEAKYNGRYEHDASERDVPLDEYTRTLIATRVDGPVGTFTLKEPQRAYWTLALYVDDDALNDAFRIDLWDETLDGGAGWNNRPGEDSDTVTRPVDGKEVRFRIVATGDISGTDPYKARLVMTIKTFDDRIMEVNLPWFNKNQYYVDSEDLQYDSEGMPQPSTDKPLSPYGDYYIIIQQSSGLADL